MKISKILANIANSKPGQKFYKWACDPNKEKFFNNTLPQVETVLSTACYVWSTARQKDIDKERKQLLQIQNVGSGVAGLVIASAANRKVSKFGEELIKELDPKKIDPKSIRKISTGIRVASPILITGFIMRFALPTILAGFSGKIMDKVREKKTEKQPQQKQLDIKV